MNLEEKQVRKFYDVIWNQYDKRAIPDVLAVEFVFRGSLGQEKTGHEGFSEYLDMVHKALGNYECQIKEIVCDANRAFARMKFSGTHRNEFMGFPATGKHVTWDGAALFHFTDGLITNLWVLGDLKSLESQLISEKT